MIYDKIESTIDTLGAHLINSCLHIFTHDFIAIKEQSFVYN
jgi:hypothetical protein